jgi:hypothetical protein
MVLLKETYSERSKGCNSVLLAASETILMYYLRTTGLSSTHVAKDYLGLRRSYSLKSTILLSNGCFDSLDVPERLNSHITQDEN